MPYTYLDKIQQIDKAVNEQFCNYTIQKINEAIQFYDQKVAEINNWLRNYEFASEKDEIHFFKNHKAKLTSKMIYYRYLFEVNLKMPTSKQKRIEYFKKILEKYSQNPKGYNTFCMYYRSQITNRDQEYYLRKNNNSDIKDQYKMVFIDERITTKMELGLAMITAREKLVTFIEAELNELECSKNKSVENSETNLKWTGTNLDFVELIYGLHNQKVINKGNADIKEITKTLCKTFNLNIEEHVFRYYIDIKRRKQNKIRFLQSMTDNLNDSLESDQ